MDEANGGETRAESNANQAKPGEAAGQPSGNERNQAKGDTVSARTLGRSDWLLIQYAIAVEGLSFSAAQRNYGVSASTIRSRSRLQRWLDPDVIRAMPSIEEIIIMRNEREILRALKSMSGQLEEALKSDTGEKAGLAMKKMEMVGKAARSAQSVARAADVSASNKRRVKAHGRAANDGAADRAAIKAELDRLAAQAPKGPLG